LHIPGARRIVIARTGQNYLTALSGLDRPDYLSRLRKKEQKMPYDEALAVRVRRAFAGKAAVIEKKMFGGLSFMLNGNMCCGVIKDTLVVRVGAAQNEAALAEPHTRPMDFTGKPMKGYVYVAPEGLATPESLDKWIGMGMQFVNTLPAK
jgi:TfoX/Sxy family transcriptional regulator of competence genes